MLVGRKAYTAKDGVLRLLPSVKLVTIAQPRRLFVNRLRGSRAQMLSLLKTSRNYFPFVSGNMRHVATSWVCVGSARRQMTDVPA